MEEIAKEFTIEPQEVVFALDSTLCPVSIYEKTDDSEKLMAKVHPKPQKDAPEMSP